MTWWRQAPVALALGALVVRGLPAQSSTPVADPSPWRVTAQLGVGTVLTPIGFVAAGWATKRLTTRAGWPADRASKAAYVVAFVGAAAAAASGPALVGDRGRWPVAFGGAAVGLGGAALAVRLGNARFDGGRPCGLFCRTLGALAFTLPATGATAAYQLSRR